MKTEKLTLSEVREQARLKLKCLNSDVAWIIDIIFNEIDKQDKEFIRRDSELDDDVIDKLHDKFCKCKDNIEVCPNDERCENCKFIDSIFQARMEERNKLAGKELME